MATVLSSVPICRVKFIRTVNNQTISPNKVTAEPTVAYVTIPGQHGYADLATVTSGVDPSDNRIGYLDLLVTDDPDVLESFGWTIRFQQSTRPTRVVSVPQSGSGVTTITVDGESMPSVWLDSLATFTGPSGASGSDLATRTYVDDALDAHEAAPDPHPNYALDSDLAAVRQVPAGGTTGQVLTKGSSTYAWADPPAGGGGSYTAENARDDVGAALRVTGAGSLAIDDPNDTITIAVDLPEATQTARTAAIGTPADLLKVTSRYDTTSGAISQPLPPATAGRVLAVGLDAGTNALTLTANGSDVIGSGSATSLALALVGEVRTLRCTTAGRWRIVSGNTPTAALDARYPANTTYTTKGDLLAASAASTPGRVGVGTNGQVLTADSTASSGVSWQTPATGGAGTSQAYVDQQDAATRSLALVYALAMGD